MFKVNEDYLKLPGSYLFSTIAKKVNAFTAANPQAEIIRLGIGDVTQPIAPAVIEALHKAVDEQTQQRDSKVMHRILAMHFCVRRSQRKIRSVKHRENSKRSIDKGLRQERIEKAIGSETNCFFYFIDIASKYKSTHSGFFCCIDVWLKIINKETFFCL